MTAEPTARVPHLRDNPTVAKVGSRVDNLRVPHPHDSLTVVTVASPPLDSHV